MNFSFCSKKRKKHAGLCSYRSFVQFRRSRAEALSAFTFIFISLNHAILIKLYLYTAFNCFRTEPKSPQFSILFRTSDELESKGNRGFSILFMEHIEYYPTPSQTIARPLSVFPILTIKLKSP